MALTKAKLGTYIFPIDNKNADGGLGEESVVGISTQKSIIKTKADLSEVDFSSYKIFAPGQFAYVPDTSRRGDKISLAFNSTNETYLVSSITTVFGIADTERLLPYYLFIFFNCPEFDRYARFNSWGSARETFAWEDMCDIEFELPDIPTQQKYVDIYLAMIANQQSYERGLEDLKLVCDGYIEDLRKRIGTEPIGPYIAPVDERNTNSEVTLAQGITIDKVFASPKQVAAAEKSAKIVRRGQFAYNRATTRNGEKISIAYREGEDCVVSAAYQVFGIEKKEKLIPEYLMMWFKRSEFDRYARYMSKGSAHEFFEYSEMEAVEIPIPDINIQKAIADIYKVYVERKGINEQLKAQIKDICPVLIKGSLEEGV